MTFDRDQVALGVSGAAWAVAIGVALVSCDVPPWRGVLPGLVGVGLLFPWATTVRAALGAVALAPLLLPAVQPDRPGEGSAVVWVLLWLAAASGGWWRRPDRWRLVAAVASLVVGMLGALPSWELAAFPEIGPLGLLPVGALVALLLLGTPSHTLTGVGLVVPALFCGALAVRLEHDATALPLGEAAWRVADHDAARLWPVVELRAAGALPARSHADLVAALEVVRAAPDRARAGSALVRAHGAELPLRVGWDPEMAIDADVAFETAISAHALGLDATAGRALAQARVPDDIQRTPGVVLARDPFDAAVDETLFLTEGPVAVLVIEAVGVPADGSDGLLLLEVGGRTWGPEVVPAGGGAWRWDPGLGPGLYRLAVRFLNDDGPGGRRLQRLRVEVR